MNIFYHFYQIIVVPIEVGFIGIVDDYTNLLIETHIQSYSIIPIVSSSVVLDNR